MIIPENFKVIGFSLMMIIGFAACDKPGSAERAGEKIDSAIEDTGQAVGEQSEKVAQKVDQTIEHASQAVSEQSDKAGTAIDDAAITSRVKAAIFAAPDLKTLQISVDTVKGEVTLSGSVNSQSSSNLANNLASAVTGVTGVVNHLAISSEK